MKQFGERRETPRPKAETVVYLLGLCHFTEQNHHRTATSLLALPHPHPGKHSLKKFCLPLSLCLWAMFVPGRKKSEQGPTKPGYLPITFLYIQHASTVWPINVDATAQPGQFLVSQPAPALQALGGNRTQWLGAAVGDSAAVETELLIRVITGSNQLEEP